MVRTTTARISEAIETTMALSISSFHVGQETL